jgi:hypothetical protein
VVVLVPSRVMTPDRPLSKLVSPFSSQQLQAPVV